MYAQEQELAEKAGVFKYVRLITLFELSCFFLLKRQS